MADRKKRPAEDRKDKFVWKEGQARIFKTLEEAHAWQESMRKKNGLPPVAQPKIKPTKPKKK